MCRGRISNEPPPATVAVPLPLPAPIRSLFDMQMNIFEQSRAQRKEIQLQNSIRRLAYERLPKVRCSGILKDGRRCSQLISSSQEVTYCTIHMSQKNHPYVPPTKCKGVTKNGGECNHL